MRPSSLEERRAFYEGEFSLKRLSRWMDGRRPVKFAMIPGRHTRIVSPGHAADIDNVVLIDSWTSLKDMLAYVLDYLPEGLYYDRNRYLDVGACAGCTRGPRGCTSCGNYDGQQLAFDLDPENVTCPYHGDIDDRLRTGRGLSFCMIEFKKVRAQAAELAALMREEYDKVSVVYSGRGFHVVVDDEVAYALTRRQRIALASRIGKTFAIDEWVTTGGSRLMRMPMSLNGTVSRICTEIKGIRDLQEFDPRSDGRSIPKFLGRSARP
jgi:DNA primase catalytic subunit